MKNNTRLYFLSMGSFWLVFGLITTFYPKLMDMFQSEVGIASKTAFSDHVWLHDGLDILALCAILFALSRATVTPTILRATAIAALLPTIGIFNSLLSTPYWNPLFIGAGLGCFVFVIWGFMLARRQSAVLA